MTGAPHDAIVLSLALSTCDSGCLWPKVGPSGGANLIRPGPASPKTANAPGAPVRRRHFHVVVVVVGAFSRLRVYLSWPVFPSPLSSYQAHVHGVRVSENPRWPLRMPNRAKRLFVLSVPVRVAFVPEVQRCDRPKAVRFGAFVWELSHPHMRSHTEPPVRGQPGAWLKHDH